MHVLIKYYRYSLCISYTLPYLEEGASKPMFYPPYKPLGSTQRNHTPVSRPQPNLTTIHNCYSCDAMRIRDICIVYMRVLIKYPRYNICISYTLPYLEEGVRDYNRDLVKLTILSRLHTAIPPYSLI